MALPPVGSLVGDFDPVELREVSRIMDALPRPEWEHVLRAVADRVMGYDPKAGTLEAVRNTFYAVLRERGHLSPPS